MSPWRVVLALLVVAVAGFAAWLAGAFLGLPSGRIGWLWSGLTWLLVLSLGVLVLAPARRAAWLAGAAVASLLIGLLLWQASPPSHDRIAAAYDGVELPAGFTETDRQESGNTWCFSECPTLDVSVAGPAGLAAGERDEALRDALEADGWRAGSGVNGIETYRKGRWRILLRASDDETLSLSVTG